MLVSYLVLFSCKLNSCLRDVNSFFLEFHPILDMNLYAKGALLWELTIVPLKAMSSQVGTPAHIVTSSTRDALVSTQCFISLLFGRSAILLRFLHLHFLTH